MGEGVDPVDEDAGRASEPDPFGLFWGVDQVPGDPHDGHLAGQHIQVTFGGLPVRAVLEVEQGDVHALTVNLDLWIKVKAYHRTMLIGELADVLSLPTETIRYYERRGLIQEPARAANGYRNYDESTLARLRFIRSAQAAGLTPAEIVGIVETRDAGTAPCTHVAALLAAKLDEVRNRQQQLAALEDEIEALIERSHRLDMADCTDIDVCHILNVGPWPASAETRHNANRRQPRNRGPAWSGS